MDGFQAVLRGAMIGLFVAAPVGPNAALCIRRTLTAGPAAGIRSGLGTASVHAFYAGLAVAGTGGVSEWMVEHQSLVRLCGGAFLVAFGLRLMGTASRPSEPRTSDMSTVAVGLTNPMTLVTFSAVVAAGAASTGSAPFTVAGVFAGSALWWAALSYGVSLLGRRLSAAGIYRLNGGSALVLACFGLAAMASAV